MTTFTEAEIRAKLGSDPQWAERAILALFAKQTIAEQAISETTQHNGVGFTGADAPILSSFAKQLQNRPGYHLSPKQLALAFRKLPKYAGQLFRIAQEDHPEKVQTVSRKRRTRRSPQPHGQSPLERSMAVYGEDEKEFEDQRTIDLYWKDRFAQREALQEQMAFLSDPDFQGPNTMAELDALALRLMRS